MLCDIDNLGKMESSDPRRKPHQFQNLQHQQQQMSSSGLLRYRSAPSSYFANFAEESDGLLDAAGPSSPETERIIARFILDGSSSPSREGFHEITKNSDPRVAGNADLGTDFMASPLMMYQSAARPPLPNQSSKATPSGSEMPDGPYTAAQARAGSAANNSNLFRHSSSPAGLFHNLNSENEFIRGMGNLGSISGSEGDASFPSPKMKSPINFSSIPDTGNNNLRATASENGSFLTGFPVGTWEEHVAFSGLDASETQGEVVNHAPPPGLSRNMSLPKTAAEVASMEKYLQFQDSVPCKIRAKRGCATHPRSIAERVRRTRISERMRKLQELVPNMDKQTSTADMLDFAVDYIKGLQNQVKRLSANRAQCTCSISCT